MKTRKVIVLEDKDRKQNCNMYAAEDLRDEIIKLRDMVRTLLWNSPDDFDMTVADAAKRMFVLNWILESMEIKDMNIPEE